MEINSRKKQEFMKRKYLKLNKNWSKERWKKEDQLKDKLKQQQKSLIFKTLKELSMNKLKREENNLPKSTINSKQLMRPTMISNSSWFKKDKNSKNKTETL